MIRTIKKWLPFGVILMIAVAGGIYLSFAEQKSAYKPSGASPSQIYREACASCHGDKGQGGLLYPALATENPDYSKIKKVISEGDMLMPAFIHIKNDTLDNLTQYIFEKAYR